MSFTQHLPANKIDMTGAQGPQWRQQDSPKKKQKKNTAQAPRIFYNYLFKDYLYPLPPGTYRRCGEINIKQRPSAKAVSPLKRIAHCASWQPLEAHVRCLACG